MCLSLFAGYGIRCTTGQNIIGHPEIQVLPVKTETCPSIADTCFTARYSVTANGQTVTAVQGVCITDAKRTCGEDFCSIIRKAAPLISGCKVSSGNKDTYL